MKVKAIIATLVMCSAAMAAQRDYVAADFPAPSDINVEKKVTGNFSVGYISNYNWKGLILDNNTSGQNATPIEFNVDAKFSKIWSAYATARYTSIWNKEDSLIGADQDEFLFQPGIAWTNEKRGLVVDGHLGAVHGGFLGSVNKWTSRDSSPDTQFAQYIGVSVQWEKAISAKSSVFVKGTADYYYSELSGCWFELGGGYKYAFSDKVSAVLEAGVSATSQYYDRDPEGSLHNGVQATWIRLSVPVTLDIKKKVTLVPFVGTYWAGSGALKVNKEIREVYGAPDAFVRPFTLVAGANVVYTF